jgi:3-dehydroquinate synthase
VQELELVFVPPPRGRVRIRVGPGALGRLVDELAAGAPGAPLLVVSDETVTPLYAEPLASRLRARGLTVHVARFPAGERGKSRESKARLEDELFRLGLGRGAAIVAVGGGVTGDLAGFVAATWHRGIPVVQVPTTLLAMVDAALGGKTAVNLHGIKNLVGAFHQPWGIYADTDTLGTLPDATYRDGLAELVKSAMVADAALLRWVEERHGELSARSAPALEHVVECCLRLKGRIVARDERETGRRAALNFGHTVGHALEAVVGERLSHGSAVAIGMCVEARLAVDATGLSRRAVGRLSALLAVCGLPTRVPRGLSPDAIVEATRLDKKVRGGRTRYALPARPGRMPPGAALTTVGEDALRGALQASSEYDPGGGTRRNTPN